MKLYSAVYIFLFALIVCAAQASAAFNITHPAANDIITSPVLFLNVTGSGVGCWFNYNQVENVSVSCSGVTQVRLPPVDGVYNLTVFEETPGTLKTISVTLKMPSGLIVVFYNGLFIALLFILIFLLLYTFGKLMTLEYDVLDLSLNIGAYFAMLGFNDLAWQYLGSEYLRDWMLSILDWTIWTNIVLPCLALLIVLIWGPAIKAAYPNVFARMPGGGGNMANTQIPKVTGGPT